MTVRYLADPHRSDHVSAADRSIEHARQYREADDWAALAEALTAAALHAQIVARMPLVVDEW